MANLSTNVCEVFSSIQGEGIFAGARQVFLRLAGCNLNCEYCDTPASHQVPKRGKYQITPTHQDFEDIKNPVDIDTLRAALGRLFPDKHHSLSITGGEPLLQPESVKEISKYWQENGGKVLLETNGTLPDALETVIDTIDIVSMDIKLAPAVRETPWQSHEEFLKICSSHRCVVYVKVVITPETDNETVQKAAQLVAGINQAIPLVLQPVTNQNNETLVSAETLFKHQWEMSRYLSDVRILPQLHKVLGVI